MEATGTARFRKDTDNICYLRGKIAGALETVTLIIQENPYMQYLVGLKYCQEEPIFSPELFVTVRKRIDKDFFNDIMLSMHRKQVKETEASDKEDNSAGDSHAEGSQKTTHKGKMKIDATYTDAEVRKTFSIFFFQN